MNMNSDDDDGDDTDSEEVPTPAKAPAAVAHAQLDVLPRAAAPVAAAPVAPAAAAQATSGEEEEIVKVEPGAMALNPFIRNVAIGTGYHKTVSQTRHTPHSAILEIIENAKGRDAKGIHLQLSTFALPKETRTNFLVSVSSTSITLDDFKVCLDQRPRLKNEKTHQLSVFGDGMKSSANCLTNGEGNLYVVATHGGERWLARYGKALDDYMGADECKLVQTRWDVVTKRPLGDEGPLEPLEQQERLNVLIGNSPFATDDAEEGFARINRMFETLDVVADKHEYEDCFMQVIGPLCERRLKEGGTGPVVQEGPSCRKAAGQNMLQVWQQGGEMLALDELVASQYVPPDCSLAGANATTDIFVSGEKVDVAALSQWNRVEAEASAALPIKCRGVTVGEMLVKELPGIGFHTSEVPLRCGVYVATQGGRLLSLNPHDFIKDQLCVNNLCSTTIYDMYEKIYGGGMNRSSFPGIFKKLTEFMVERCEYTRAHAERFCELAAQLGKVKEDFYRAVGASSVALVQLHIYLPTDTSKCKLDAQQPSTTVDLTEEDPAAAAAAAAAASPIDSVEVLGAIYRTLFEHTFGTQLAALEQEAKEAATAAAATEAKKAAAAEARRKQAADKAAAVAAAAQEEARAAAERAKEAQHGDAKAKAKAKADAAAKKKEAAAAQEKARQAEAANAEAKRKADAASKAEAAAKRKRDAGAAAGPSSAPPPASKKQKKKVLTKAKIAEEMGSKIDKLAGKTAAWPADAKKFFKEMQQVRQKLEN